MKKLHLALILLLPLTIFSQTKHVTEVIKNPLEDPSCLVQRTMNDGTPTIFRNKSFSDNFSRRVNDHQIQSYIDYLIANNICGENEIISQFEKLEPDLKRKLTRSFAFVECKSFKKLYLFQAVIREYDKKKMNNLFWHEIIIIQKLKGYQKEFKQYLQTHVDNQSSQTAPGKLIASLDIENDQKLKKIGFEKLLKFHSKNGIIYSNYRITDILIQFLSKPATKEYGIEKALKILNPENTYLGKRKSHWHKLLLELHDHLPANDWCKIIEQQDIILFDEYFGGYEGITYLFELYSNIKGMASLFIYEDKLDKEKITDPGMSMGYYQTIGLVIKGFRAILESPSVNADDKRKILTLLNDNSLFKVEGYLKPNIITTYFLAGASFDDICDKFPDPNDQKYFLKIRSIGPFDKKSLFNSIYRNNLISENNFKAKHCKTSYAGSCFPYNDFLLRGTLKNLGVTVEMDAEIGRVPIPYDEILDEYLSTVKDFLPNYKINFEAIKLENRKYEYHLEFITDKYIYAVKPSDYGDYYHAKPVRDLINTVLYDQNSNLRLIELDTNDQGTFSIYTEPEDLKNLYNEFKLALDILR
ncbi:MAG: hypothetical protein AAFZ15_07910 [Bacteroidota bacterium]